MYNNLSISISTQVVFYRPGNSRAAHHQHAGHGQRAEDVEQVAFLEDRFVAVDEVPDSSLGQLHTDFSQFATSSQQRASDVQAGCQGARQRDAASNDNEYNTLQMDCP